MNPWYKVVTPREEVRKGRSFHPDEFAIALEQIVAGKAPEDYQNPVQFFSRTCFTRALRDHAGMVLRRLEGKTENTAPVLALITQFGGGKTHTLTTLYHIAKNGDLLYKNPETSDMLSRAELPVIKNVKTAVFVGNAWDPQEGRETPWIDIARQLAGDQGVSLLGKSALTTPPGTEALLRLFAAANGPVLILMDEVLNFFNRHREMADPCYAFFDNLYRSIAGSTNAAMLVSLPRSQVEMTNWDIQWQQKITKVLRRVAKDLIVADEAEISEVVRRRLFEDIGNERSRNTVAREYARWCFDRRAQLPPEWTAVDTATTEANALALLEQKFQVCYPFHPATLSVFQRKWQALPQFQQTRGTLAMLAQWISLAYRKGYKNAHSEQLITLGSAPLEVREFRSIILGELGEPRLIAAIDADISGQQAHSRVLDLDTKGPLADIHRRVATTILFESSGGQVDKMAHLPELRFALGSPEIDTTSVDTAAFALEAKAFFIRKMGSDGFQVRYQPTLKKVVNDRRASLDEDTEIKPSMRTFIQNEFNKGASIPTIFFPGDGTEIQDSPKLMLVVMDTDSEWLGSGSLRSQTAEWTRQRGKSPRLYPGSLVFCFKKQGRDLRDKVEMWLAWKRVAKDIAEGVLGSDFDRTDRADIQSKVKDAEVAVRDEVWGEYRYIVMSDTKEPDGLKVIDLGAGHSSSGETLCGRVITALKSQALLNESVGAGYIDRNWPPALKDAGAWPLTSLRQSFLNGSLTRLIDPDAVLRSKIVEFVGKGEFGLASCLNPDGTYERTWFKEFITPDEVAFETGVVLLKKDKASALKGGIKPTPKLEPQPLPGREPEPALGDETVPVPAPIAQTQTLRIAGNIPPEVWNRLGTKVLPKLRSGENFKIGIDFTATFSADTARNIETDLRQILDDLALSDKIKIEKI